MLDSKTTAWGALGSLLLGGLAIAAGPFNSPGEQAPPPPASSRLTNVFVEIPELPFEALVKAATNVVYGRVLGSTPVFPDSGMAYTVYELEVQASFKHPVGERMSVGVAGAEGPDAVTQLTDAPTFEVGEELVLLTWSGTSELPDGILGLGLGVYRIRLGVDGELTATRDRGGLELPFHRLVADIDSVLFGNVEGK